MTLPIKSLPNVAVLNPRLVKGPSDNNDLRAKGKQRLDGDFTGFSDLKLELEKCFVSLTALNSSSTQDHTINVYQSCRAALLEALKLNPSTRNRVLAFILPTLKERFPENFAPIGGTHAFGPTIAESLLKRPTWKLLAEELKETLPHGQRSQVLSDLLPKPATYPPLAQRWQSLSFGNGRQVLS